MQLPAAQWKHRAKETSVKNFQWRFIVGWLICDSFRDGTRRMFTFPRRIFEKAPPGVAGLRSPYRDGDGLSKRKHGWSSARKSYQRSDKERVFLFRGFADVCMMAMKKFLRDRIS
jgi:hypothetical protein